MKDAQQNPKSPEHLRKFYELSSAFFCEAAVLVVVFGFLEKILRQEPVGLLYSFAVVLVTMGSFMVGFVLAILRDK